MNDLDTTVTIDGKTLSTKELLYIDQADLSDEFASQAARYAYFAVLSANADYLYALAKDNAKRLYANLFNEIKQNPDNIPAGGKTVSDALAENLVLTAASYVSAGGQEIDAQHQAKLLRALTDSFEQRAYMLRELGQSARSEMAQTGMSIRSESLPPREERVNVVRAKKAQGYDAAEWVTEELPDPSKAVEKVSAKRKETMDQIVERLRHRDEAMPVEPKEKMNESIARLRKHNDLQETEG